MPVIGWLHAELPEAARDFLLAFHEGLAQTGYVEGRNVATEYRWADGHPDRLPALAADLVRGQVAVIVTPGNILASLAAKAATPAIPVVFMVGADPVEVGLVASFSRPGGNVTGVAGLSSAVAAKRLALLHEMVPAAGSIAMLVNPANAYYTQLDTRDVPTAARALGVQLLILNAGTESDLTAAFGNLAAQRVGAVLVGSDLFFVRHAIKSYLSRPSMRSPPCSWKAKQSHPGHFRATVPTSQVSIASLAFTLGGSSKAKTRRTCQSSSRPSSNLRSTCEPRKRSPWKFHLRS
jgi:putative ABC transport system substrate-binding protein